MDINKVMIERSLEWKANNPDATEEETKVAFDEIAKEVVDEFMRSI